MRGAGYGRIVNIASVAGKDGNPNASAYSASKAAVIALTKSLGKELADTGVRVNCVTPAAVKTRDLRPDERGAHPVHAVQDPDGPLRHARGSGGAWWAGCAPRSARFPPARCSTCRAGDPPTELDQQRKERQSMKLVRYGNPGKEKPGLIDARRQAARLEQRRAATSARRNWAACGAGPHPQGQARQAAAGARHAALRLPGGAGAASSSPSA